MHVILCHMVPTTYNDRSVESGNILSCKGHTRVNESIMDG